MAIELTRMPSDQLAALNEDEAWVLRWQHEATKEAVRWRRYDTCPQCGERIGHFAGSVDRDPCGAIPLGLPLEEVRPNRLEVRRPRLGDAIRAALCQRADLGKKIAPG